MGQFIQQVVQLHSSSFLLSTHYGQGTFLRAEATMQSRAGPWSPGAHCSHVANDGRTNCLLLSRVLRLLEPRELPPGSFSRSSADASNLACPTLGPHTSPSCLQVSPPQEMALPPTRHAGQRRECVSVACRDLLLTTIHPAPLQSICSSHEVNFQNRFVSIRFAPFPFPILVEATRALTGLPVAWPHPNPRHYPTQQARGSFLKGKPTTPHASTTANLASVVSHGPGIQPRGLSGPHSQHRPGPAPSSLLLPSSPLPSFPCTGLS